MDRLQTEASSEASHKSYCDEETPTAAQIQRDFGTSVGAAYSVKEAVADEHQACR